MKSSIQVLMLFIVMICIGCTTSAPSLIDVALRGEAEKVRELIAQGADVNKGDTDGFTPLFRASENGHVEVVKILLSTNAEVNKADTINSGTPLLVASQNGHVEVVKILLSASAKVNVIVDVNGEAYTALKVARLNGADTIVELLKKHGAQE